ncbi:Argininosuccinate lyase [Variovorax sp. PBL-E5]|nr:tripartite tricarboxylate transporter substrate-binding protein [Variovorax sp. PBL-E5]VTU32043.1 Argininosuccinate lyase [Variovorax sp. PBL-E5]
MLPLHGLAAAADWPHEKPITWIVGFAPGGSLDVLTRLAARRLSEKTGQPVVVDNRPGASGVIALQAAAKAAPDGYTLISIPGPILFNQRPPELGKELVAVARIAEGPMVLVGPAAAPTSTVAELLAAMRATPKAWSYASSGNGTSQHLAGELFNITAGTAMTHIPYKGGGQAVTDVVGGQVPLAILGVTPVLPQIKAGKLKAYAVTSSYRIESLPEVPTMQEAGLKGYEATQWYVVGAPARTPAARVTQLNAWINEIMASSELRPALVSSGSIAGKGSARDTQAFVATETNKWKDIAHKSGLTLD